MIIYFLYCKLLKSIYGTHVTPKSPILTFKIYARSKLEDSTSELAVTALGQGVIIRIVYDIYHMQIILYNHNFFVPNIIRIITWKNLLIQALKCTSLFFTNCNRPLWYRGNVFALRSKVHRFKLGWGRWIFSGRKTPEHNSSGVPSLRFQACKRTSSLKK